MTAKNASVIAVHESSQTAGLMTWWTLGGQTSLEALTLRWAAAGLPLEWLPEPPTDKVGLKRGLQALHPACDVTPLKGGGYAVVETLRGERGEGKDPTMRTQYKAWYDEEGELCTEARAQTPDKKAIWQATQEALGRLEAVDVSQWLVARAEALGAVALRQSGGVYFVPPGKQSELWRRMTEQLEAVSRSKVYEVPAMRTERAVEAILDALRGEVEREATHIKEQLDKGDMGIRALKSRKAETDAMEKKARMYERLLGKNLDDLLKSIEDLDLQVTKMILRDGPEEA